MQVLLAFQRPDVCSFLLFMFGLPSLKPLESQDPVHLQFLPHLGLGNFFHYPLKRRLFIIQVADMWHYIHIFCLYFYVGFMLVCKYFAASNATKLRTTQPQKTTWAVFIIHWYLDWNKIKKQKEVLLLTDDGHTSYFLQSLHKVSERCVLTWFKWSAPPQALITIHSFWFI